MMEWKTFNVHFTPQKISPKTTLSSVVTLSLAHFRKTFFPLLASALNAYRMDGFDLSLLIISPRFCLAQLKKKSCAFNVYAAHWLPFDVGVFVASCSTAMLLCHQRYALFSLFDCWLFIRVHYFPFTLIERG